MERECDKTVPITPAASWVNNKAYMSFFRLLTDRMVKLKDVDLSVIFPLDDECKALLEEIKHALQEVDMPHLDAREFRLPADGIAVFPNSDASLIVKPGTKPCGEVVYLLSLIKSSDEFRIKFFGCDKQKPHVDEPMAFPTLSELIERLVQYK